MKRRNFLVKTSVAGSALMFPIGLFNQCSTRNKAVPSYLKDYSKIYNEDPRQASLSWFKEAKFGLFMHYGLYSLTGRGAWVQLLEKIPVVEYMKLMNDFTAENFDADFIVRMAKDTGMKYVNITTKHHDGFCLFKTAQTDYQTLNTPAKRDLVAELKTACDKHGLGLFLYYSIAADWHHPYFCDPKAGWRYFRPDYDEPQPEYLYKTESDFIKYIDYVKAQIKELVGQYQPAGIWFDPLMGFYARPDMFPMEEIYAQIRAQNPSTLVSFKQGATGTEDFAAPERSAESLHENVKKEFGESFAPLAEKVWEANKNKHNETCSTMQRGAWAYKKNIDGKNNHLNVEQIMELIHDANEVRSMNLLLNTGPMPDGSINPKDVKTLEKIGQLLKSK